VSDDEVDEFPEMRGPVWEEVRGFYFDRQRKAISLRDWTLHNEDRDYRILGRANPVDDLWVSTVWDGTNVEIGRVPGLIFESAVFRGVPGDGGVMVASFRMDTEERALAVQAYLVAYVTRHSTWPETVPYRLDELRTENIE
jgi:hypothetical protein